MRDQDVPTSTPSRPLALPDWVRWFEDRPMTIRRRLETVTLLATIPAFYLALQGAHRAISVSLYVAASVATTAVVWQEWGGQDRPRESSKPQVHDALGLMLIAGLAVSAAVPAGAEVDWMTARLATALLVVMRMGDSLRPIFWRGQLARVLPVSIAVLLLSGLGFWWLEPRVQSFGDGLWLAFTTAATVGYGDIVPSTPASKIFAVFVVMTGFAMLSTVTAAIAATWVQTEERRIEREILADLHHQLRAIREELASMRRMPD